MNDVQAGSIVVAVDGSEHAEAALYWAAEQASLERRLLVVVTAVNARDYPGSGSMMRGDDLPAGTSGLLAGARSIADTAARKVRCTDAALTVEAAAVVGDPRRVLIELSDQAHLLVLGSRGRGTVRSMLLGSVSAEVVKQATCPVVVCRPRSRVRSIRGVIVGADGTPESLPVLEFAFHQASLRGLPLTVLHCFWDAVVAVAGYRVAPGDLLDAPALEELRVVLSESVAGFSEKFPDVPVTLRLAHGLVDEALSPRGRIWDLIVVGRHPMNSLARTVTGSIATAVLERAHTTVAVVPEAPSSTIE